MKSKKMVNVLIFMFELVLFFFNINLLQAQSFPTSREPFLWPFAQTSIWNMPIGNNAQYAPAGLKSVSDFPNVYPYWAGGVKVDEEPIIKANDTDPLVDVYTINSNGWGYRCTFSTPSGQQIHFPSTEAFPDPNGSINTPNYSGVIAMADGTLFHFNALATCGGGKIALFRYTNTENDTWFKSGSTGGHGGSGLSGYGGSIRKGELLGNNPIRHAIKLNILAARYLVYNNDATPGYCWPATKCDSYANPSSDNVWGYGTTNINKYSYMEMGVLLAIKPDATPTSIGITNVIAIKLFHAFQDYGAYAVDDTHWNNYDIPMEKGVAEEVNLATGMNLNNTSSTDSYYQDMMKIFTNLYAITNNGPTNIGGGGTPRQFLAPPFTIANAEASVVLGDKNISIYPNPTSGVIKIVINNKFDSDYTVEVYDNVGRLLQTLKKKRSVADFDIDLGKYPAGLYIIRIHASSRYYENKVIINRL